MEDLEKDMISAFNSGINADGIKENIDLIAKASLVDSSDLSKQITDYLYYACGPISKLEVVFNEEIIFHEIISNKRYRFMDSDYESSYKDVVKQFNETYYSMRDSLLNNLVVPEIVLKKLKQHIKDFIEESYEQILTNINSLSDIILFEFLNLTYSLKNISIDYLSKEKEALIKSSEDNIDLFYNMRFEDIFKTQVLLNADK